MRLFPAVKENMLKTNLLAAALVCGLALLPSGPARAQGNANVNNSLNNSMNAQIEAAMRSAQQSGTRGVHNAFSSMDQQGMSSGTAARRSQQGLNPAGMMQPQQQPQMTQAEYNALLKDKDSPQYKAEKLADQAKNDLDLFGGARPENDVQNVTGDIVTPPEVTELQQIHKTHGSSHNISDEMIAEELALDMRRDSQREAALSYGARGGLAKKAYMLTEKVSDFEPILDKVFNFRQLLVRAPSGLLIEPPIVSEALDALVIEQGGNEAAVADQVLKINRQARIVSAPRDWRQYLVFAAYAVEIPPPPRVLWPKNKEEQADWNTWVRQGWDAGYSQGDDIFEANLAKLVADYNGMVRYRTLLAEGKISQPFALQEDRGVTGGNDEMRVGDRALRITGPSQFLTGANLWKPANR